MTRDRMPKTSRGLGRAVGVLGAIALPVVAFASSCSDGGATGTTTGTQVTSGGSSGAGTVPTGTTTGGGATTTTGSGGGSVTGAPQGGAGGTVTPSGGGATVGSSGAGASATGSAGMGTGGTMVSAGGATAGGGGQGTSTAGAGTAGAGTAGAASGCGILGPRPAPAIGTWPPPNLTLTEVSDATQPTAIAAPRCDPSRLYFAEKWGRIRLIKDGVLVEEPALDIRDAVLEGGPTGDGNEQPNQGKRGLVGLAFDPNYEENGRIFVLYVADQGEQGVYGNAGNRYDDGDMTVEEYRRSATDPDKFDPASGNVILQFDKGNCGQCSQHNGGSLEIGVDGFLWASTGDPPPYDDPGSQDLNNLNGKLLRFDISGDTVTPAGNYPGADPHVWSIGIRNAYKFSIDRYTGDVYVADVGENSWEEVTVERHGDGHKNHEWPWREGSRSLQSPGICNDPNCLPPVFDYGHTGAEGDPGADNCIIGGYVYRGEAIPALQGAYLYTDYGSGKMRAVQIVDGALVNQPHDFPGVSVFGACFGEDAAGELYICDYDENRIVRVDAQ